MKCPNCGAEIDVVKLGDEITKLLRGVVEKLPPIDFDWKAKAEAEIFSHAKRLGVIESRLGMRRKREKK